MVKRLKTENKITVSSIRRDNAGENKKMEEMCIDQDLEVSFEYTSVGTPQQNVRVERKFTTLCGRIRLMMIDARMEKELRQKLWAEATNMTTHLDNILVTNKNNKNAYEFFYNKQSHTFIFNLKRLGEVGYILKRDKGMKIKIRNR